jgi:hypothetical protein
MAVRHNSRDSGLGRSLDWDVPSPQVDVMLWVCVLALAFGFFWAAYRLVHPR